MITDLQKLKNFIQESGRKIPNQQWLDDELFAIEYSNLAGRFLELKDSEFKYDNTSQSVVAWLIGITDIKPINAPDLYIDKGRNDFPDIDMDFEHRRRDEIKEYVREKYGDVLGISTYTELKAKSLVRSIARALCIPLSEVDAACKQFNTLDEYETAEGTKEFRNRHPEILGLAKKLEGHISAAGMHAAGVVIADRPMYMIAPVESRPDPDDNKKRIPVCAFDMNDAAEVGLIKFDFLGLNTLTVIHDCIDLIKERHGLDIDWENFEPDDPAVLDDLNGANTVGVFQMESSPYRKLLAAMGVDSFEDLVASNALVRPGAFLTVAQDYIKRKKGLQQVTYPTAECEEWLKDTYGTYIYQEQVMALTVVLADFAWGKADKLRKIIGKKLSPEEFAPYYQPWIEVAGDRIGQKAAEKMWHDFEKHSGYSFNRSHAVAYSYIGYVTAWLKHYYPLEYLYSLLRNEKKDTTRTTYLLEAKRLGIDILPPCVQKSQEDMSVDGEALRFGLGNVKSVGPTACDEVVSKRPYADWEDFNERIASRRCNSRVVESLVAVDAFANVDKSPRHPAPEENYQEYLNYPIALEAIGSLGLPFVDLSEYDEESGEFCLVSGVVKEVKRTAKYVRIELEDVSGRATVFGAMDNDLSEREVVVALIGDRTMVGYTRADGFKERLINGNLDAFESYISGNLLDHFDLLHRFGFGSLGMDKVLAVPLQVREVTTKTNKKMCFAYLGDGQNVFKLTIFPQQWGWVKDILFDWKPVCLRIGFTSDGSLTLAQGGQSIIAAEEVLTEIKKKIGE